MNVFRSDKTLGESWQAYFQSLESEGGTGGVTGSPSWQRGDWPPAINGEMTAVLDGNWAEDLSLPVHWPKKCKAAWSAPICHARRDTGFGARHYDDTRLSFSRSFGCRFGSAAAGAASQPSGA